MLYFLFLYIYIWRIKTSTQNLACPVSARYSQCTHAQAKTSGPKTFRHTSKTVHTAPQTRHPPSPPPPPNPPTPAKVSASVVVGCRNLYRNPATTAQSVKGTIHSHFYNPPPPPPPLQAGLLLLDLYTHLITRSLALSLSLPLTL